MRIALITEGTYPYVAGGVSTWCQQLLTGLDRHAFQLVAITAYAGGQRAAYELPPNVAAVRTVPVWDRARPATGWVARGRHRRSGTAAAVPLCRGLLDDGPKAAGLFAGGLRQLAQQAAGGAHPLHDVPLAEVLVDAWQASRVAGGDVRLPLPRLSLRDARDAAVLLEHAVRPLAHRLPPVDACHPVAAGLPLLVALAAKWRTGTPYLLTEHGSYLRERYLEYGDSLPVAVKAVMLRFYRALARLGYAEAAVVSSVSDFNRRWELRHGAEPARVRVVPNGVAPDAYPALAGEPADPTVVWVGRIDPLKDLHTLVRAFDTVRREVPGARLRLAGPVPATGADYARSCHALVDSLGLREVVEFAGPVASSREAYATGSLVALSSISEGMPYTVIEAMMCGRATVSTDVGGVAETVGDAGVVVPPGDPAAFAAGCVRLLRDPAERARLGEAARARALARYTLPHMLAAYDDLYGEVAATAPVRLPVVDRLPAADPTIALAPT
ncbi:MAG TPA: GT4 family glycosyltransferase PelF [Pilimelia sp.]|nr:GT4 family glycosyltransferase PelF [Pilimelia sp.]